jgi:hypothetical protein
MRTMGLDGADREQEDRHPVVFEQRGDLRGAEVGEVGHKI